MSTFDTGDKVPLQHRVYSSGVLAAATVTLTVTAPNGTTSTPSVSSSSTGVYNATVSASSAGIWTYAWSVSGSVPDDVIYGQFTVETRAPLAYGSLAKLKLKLGVTDTARDELLADALAASSRYIDRLTGRRFYADTAATARVYQPRRRVVRDDDGEWLLVDDIATTTDLVVETGSAVGSYTATTSYETGPENAYAVGLPTTKLLALGGCWAAGQYARVRVTARWGWPFIPDEVAEATVIQAARLYRRKDSPEGVTGSADWGVIAVTRVDPDVMSLVQPFILPGFG